MVMFAMRKKFGLGLVCGRLATAMLLVALALSAAMSAAAQTPEKIAADHNVEHGVEHNVDRTTPIIATSINTMNRSHRKPVQRG